MTSQSTVESSPIPVTVDTFVRAESDTYMKQLANPETFGKIQHRREASVDAQDVIRMNMDTLYSSGIFDLTTPITIRFPDAGKRWQSIQVVNQDHYCPVVIHQPRECTLDQATIGTRYAGVIIRTLVDSSDPDDTAKVNALQDQITWSQSDPGSLELPNWDQASLKEIRDALNTLARFGDVFSRAFGRRDEVDPIKHLIGTAAGWGGNPPYSATYVNFEAEQNDGRTPHQVTLADVPVDGFWSVTVYNKDGFIDPNDLGAYVINDRNAVRNTDGSVTVHFGGDPAAPNYLPIMDGWNYVLRLYQPRPEILAGTWRAPGPVPASA